MVTNIQRSENHKDICKFENCDRVVFKWVIVI